MSILLSPSSPLAVSPLGPLVQPQRPGLAAAAPAPPGRDSHGLAGRWRVSPNKCHIYHRCVTHAKFWLEADRGTEGKGPRSLSLSAAVDSEAGPPRLTRTRTKMPIPIVTGDQLETTHK